MVFRYEPRADEGLDRDFNTLDAQRDAAEKYISSQEADGWSALPDRYDDGGFTGANTNRPAFQRLLRDIDDEMPSSREILRQLYPHTGNAYIVGFTGSPGVGKSTLVDQIALRCRQDGLTVGILAVDPTSPFTGGAILGDRIRMQRHFLDGGVFIRSLATRAHFGGLTRSTNDMINVLDAMGKQKGYIEREVLEADTHFDWQQLLDAGNSMSLFADKRILDLRLPSGKPGKQGSDVLQAYAARPADDAVLIISAGKLESAAKNSKWFKSLDEAGVGIQCWPVNVTELPRWIERRMRDRGMQPATGAAALLAERVEGNLLAAAQEVDKLLLLYGAVNISVQQVMEAVADSARYSVYDLVDAVLAADVARAVRMVAGLQAEGEALTLVVWALSREVRSLVEMSELGLSAEAAVIKAGVWENPRGSQCRRADRHRRLRTGPVSLGLLYGGQAGVRFPVARGISRDLSLQFTQYNVNFQGESGESQQWLFLNGFVRY